ncbi:MAG: LysM peptidoglycan-binding domain-containing protein, partial [Acidobacteria bacterium]|nr:LysM peptidoglycan-binding domain-containing protein [Acidobacteriota bacterium]
MHRVALLGLGLFAAGLAAGEGPPLDRGWHVVRPGDTLEGITAYYLGSPARWRENWALNPGIKDPDLLHPGERLQVLVSPEHSRHAALVWRRARLVDAQQPPRDWMNAEIGDLLVRRDGVRTGARSSAELAFTDGSRIWMTENSLVFLRSTARAPRVAPSREVEIVSGRADLELTAPAARAAAVEVVMGPARASVRAAAGEGAQSR